MHVLVLGPAGPSTNTTTQRSRGETLTTRGHTRGVTAGAGERSRCTGRLRPPATAHAHTAHAHSTRSRHMRTAEARGRGARRARGGQAEPRSRPPLPLPASAPCPCSPPPLPRLPTPAPAAAVTLTLTRSRSRCGRLLRRQRTGFNTGPAHCLHTAWPWAWPSCHHMPSRHHMPSHAMGSHRRRPASVPRAAA